MTAETTAGSSARAERDASLAQKSDDKRCLCGQPLEGFDAQVGEAVCADCAKMHGVPAEGPTCEIDDCGRRSRYVLPRKGHLCQRHAQKLHPVLVPMLRPSAVALARDGDAE